MAKRSKWQMNSWRNYPIKQQPNYENQQDVKRVEDFLSLAPPLTYFAECQRLKHQLANVCHGKAFLLQGGDCAESFQEFNQINLTNYFQVILQMTFVLMQGLNKPVVKVGRIAGQFAKPRSSDTETIDGVTYPSYRGDMVNSLAVDMEARRPNPENLINGYKQSAVTLNYLRSLASGGFASLDNVSGWIKEFTDEYVNSSQTSDKIFAIIEQLQRSIDFIKSCSFDIANNPHFNSADFFVSHEGLLLNYEEALTRKNPQDKKYYCLSSHMLWIGDRTRALDEAHIEFMRGLANPVGVKVGPATDKLELLEVIDVLNPENEAGKITLITRMGADKVNELLPGIVEYIRDSGRNVIWSCDPMHGNTETSSSGYKTRRFDNIIKEVEQFFAIHHKLGTYPGGIHIEMTGQNVTECLGGMQGINDQDLKDRYHTHCDPRLNGWQGLELALLISSK
ncbi:MAG: 3-deoxy-7-phosphoheptulonate synthase [Rickettsiales bacterium]|jgi:3-deoxy-7-phosphoheptulonate synthase|nr:3-deoxy-7-phosphoheptulonate synthase [Rickettsiales bacterium]